mmetsp:Transcript_4862/g.16824  ORF Transcript_4862/g.16824 Transcript_4862/m.16824 type:complete len:278 (-) Transcript_4862:2189-3022(-)
MQSLFFVVLFCLHRYIRDVPICVVARSRTEPHATKLALVCVPPRFVNGHTRPPVSAVFDAREPPDAFPARVRLLLRVLHHDERPVRDERARGDGGQELRVRHLLVRRTHGDKLERSAENRLWVLRRRSAREKVLDAALVDRRDIVEPGHVQVGRHAVLNHPWIELDHRRGGASTRHCFDSDVPGSSVQVEPAAPFREAQAGSRSEPSEKLVEYRALHHRHHRTGRLARGRVQQHPPRRARNHPQLPVHLHLGILRPRQHLCAAAILGAHRCFPLCSG